MMSILSYLLGSGWLSNQRPALHCHSTCSRSPDHSRAHHCFFFSFSSTVACFLSFVDRRPADSRQTKPGRFFWSGSVSKSHFQQTWIWRVSCNTRHSSLIPCSAYKPSWYEQLINKTICCKPGPPLFFSITATVDTTLSFHFIKPSHYFSFLFESHLHSEFKGSSDWLIGKSDYICNYIDTYSKLMWLLHCELTPRNLDNYLCDCIMLLRAKCQHKRWAIGGFTIWHRQLHAESFTAVWLDSDAFCPPSALQNMFWWGVIKTKNLFKAAGWEKRESKYILFHPPR